MRSRQPGQTPRFPDSQTVVLFQAFSPPPTQQDRGSDPGIDMH